MSGDERKDAFLAEMREQTALLRLILVALKNPDAVPSATTSTDASVIAGPYGDPVIKAKDPRDWTGDPMNGKHFSECPAEYLDLLASRYDYFAGRETDEKKAGYNRLDARRARGWAARIRGGWTAPQPSRVADETQTEPQW